MIRSCQPILFAAVVLVLLGEGSMAQIDFGIDGRFTHSAFYIGPEGTLSSGVMEDLALPATNTYSYNRQALNQPGEFATASSSFLIAISPGVHRMVWEGEAELDGTAEVIVGNPDANATGLAAVDAELRWFDKITLTHPTLPPGSPIKYWLSNHLDLQVTNEYDAGLDNISLLVRFARSTYGGGTTPTSLELTATLNEGSSEEEEYSEYGGTCVCGRVGDSFVVETRLFLSGSVRVVVENGEVFDEVDPVSMTVDLGNTARFGIGLLTPGAGYTAASGHTYPTDARPLAELVSIIEQTRITDLSRDPVTGAVSLFSDAVPGVRYTLQRSPDLRPGSWIDVDGPSQVAEPTRLELSDLGTLGAAAYWRVVAAPIPGQPE